MKRAMSLIRAPSPTNTTFSGISNYRSEQFRQPQRGRNPSMSLAESKAIAQLHYEEISNYLGGHLTRESANARGAAREKLTRLTKQQFQELSTDVYDELLRRKNNTPDLEVPFLPVRDDFHPKRNQARQKLATLPIVKFRDLSGDVLYELGRRYPEFQEPETLDQPSPTSNYDDVDVPSPDFPQSSRSKASNRSASETENVYPGGSNGRRPSEDSYRRRPSEDAYGGRAEDGMYGNARRPSEDSYSRDAFSGPSRRKPSQDTVNLRNEDRRRFSPDPSSSSRRPSEEFERKHSTSVSMSSDQTTNASNAQREVIVPTKSTIAEEDIEVPYGRGRQNASTASIGRLSRTSDLQGKHSPVGDLSEGDSTHPRSPPLDVGGLNTLSARLRERNLDEDEDEDTWSGQGRSGEEYYDKMSFGRASVASDRSMNMGLGPRSSGSGVLGRLSKGGVGDDVETVRREYEFKVATLQSRLASLERDLEDAEEREKRLLQSVGNDNSKNLQLETQINKLLESEDEQQVTILNLKRELSELREESTRQQDLLNKRGREDAAEIAALRHRCDQLGAQNRPISEEVDSDAVEQLRSDLETLMTELEELSLRNDELLSAKDSDLAVIQNLDAQLKEYKRKYEQAKTELRGLKATSQLYSQTLKVETDQLPVSSEGGIVDIHLTSFVSSIDNLLTAGRSQSPRRVLSPMMAVVNAVSAIIDDLRSFERKRGRIDMDSSVINTLQERVEATLSNLVATANAHATSMGMAPISLLDAAASHLSATVTEIGKAISIRKASKAEHDRFNSSLPVSTMLSGTVMSSSLSSIEEGIKPNNSRQQSLSRRSDGQRTTEKSLLDFSRPVFGSGSSVSSSNLPERTSLQNDGTLPDNSEDAWLELKPYLEAQSESIVYAIQSVLSSVRSQNPSPSLAENLTQIITIVSSIVAVCNDNVPPESAAEGNSILRELGDQANRLSEVQALGEVTKESRQVMAKSSYAIANAMKELMKL